MRESVFLLACVRRFLWPDSPLPEVSALNWGRALAIAEDNLVAPLFAWTVCNTYANVVPQEILEDLRRRYQETARANLIMSGELARVLLFFEEQKIAAVPLKGPSLTATLYGNLALRTFSDLDILIRPSDVLSAKTMLETRGYRLDSTLHWPCDSACFRARDSQLSFKSPGTLICVDVHWRLLPNYFPNTFDIDELWDKLRTVPFAGGSARTLCPEHVLLFLCAHGAKHNWERLGWVCDVARLIQVETGLDWRYILAQADERGTSRMLFLGLLLASNLLGVQIPKRVAQCMAVDPRASALADAVGKHLKENSPASNSTLLTFRAFERSAHRLRYFVGVLITPTEAEYRDLQLPPSFYWLYYAFRPLRLIAKHTRRIADLSSTDAAKMIQ